MLTPTDISASTTHDLWIDSRQLSIDISRPTPTTIKLTVLRPAQLNVLDGAVVLLSDKPISGTNYPADTQRYSASSTPSWLAPTATIGGAQVVGAYYGIFNEPFPATESTETSATVTGYPSTFQAFSITVENTNPNTVYYASVHGATNTLQYYPIGVQSYPLLGSVIERGSSAYTGNIPTFPVAPTAPVPGMVYHDQQLNLVQYYDGHSGSWIPTRADTIVSGPYNPGVLGQVYLLGGAQLKIFNGTRWVDGTPSNLQLKVGATWVPLTRLSSQVITPTGPLQGDLFYDYTLQRIQYHDGTTWVYPNATNTLFNTGSALVPAFITPLTVEPEALRDPYIGQLFYNTTQQELNAWNGASWNKVNTDQEGVPSTDKISIGTDGSYDARVQLIKILQSQLGYPQLCVELQEEQFNIGIDNALDTYRQLSGGAYRRGFLLYKLIPGQQKYYLNSAIDKTDHIVDIHKIHRCGPLGVYAAGPQDVWAQYWAQQYYNLTEGRADLLSVNLIAMYGEEMEKAFAGELMFQWDEQSHELYIIRAVRGYETVVIEAMLERSEQELLQDRFAKQFLQGWSMAELKMMLGLIRSKFSSGTPGPAGSISLNGELLVSEARQDMMELKEELLNYEFGGPVGLGNCSFIFG